MALFMGICSWATTPKLFNTYQHHFSTSLIVQSFSEKQKQFNFPTMDTFQKLKLLKSSLRCVILLKCEFFNLIKKYHIILCVICANCSVFPNAKNIKFWQIHSSWKNSINLFIYSTAWSRQLAFLYTLCHQP